jgi:hypothetical protein
MTCLAHTGQSLCLQVNLLRDSQGIIDLDPLAISEQVDL